MTCNAPRPGVSRRWRRRCLRLTAAVICMAGATPALFAEPARIPIDGIAAVVGGKAPAPGVDVILRSDVELRARLELLGQGDGSASGLLPNALLAATLNAMVGEHVIAREARRLQVVRASAADVARERERLIRSAGGLARLQQALDAWGVPTAEVDAIARRRALVGAFLSANLAGGAAIANGELERWVTLLRARTPMQLYARYE